MFLQKHDYTTLYMTLCLWYRYICPVDICSLSRKCAKDELMSAEHMSVNRISDVSLTRRVHCLPHDF